MSLLIFGTVFKDNVIVDAGIENVIIKKTTIYQYNFIFFLENKTKKTSKY